MGSLAMFASSAFAGEVIVDKGVVAPQEPTKWWSADLTFGYDSLYIYRGLSVFGNSANDGLIWTNLSGTFTPVTNLSFTAGVWWGNSFSSPTFSSAGFYNELDVYTSVTYTAGPVDLSVGYIYYNYPYLTPDGLYDTHEVSFAAAYTALPYVTPSMIWFYDCGRYQGWYSEIRLDGEIPVYGDIVTLNPMFWTSFDFGSLRKQFDFNRVTGGSASLGGQASINDIGVGLAATIQLNEVISFSPYVKASFPVGVGTAINKNWAGNFNGSNNHVWSGANVTFSF